MLLTVEENLWKYKLTIKIKRKNKFTAIPLQNLIFILSRNMEHVPMLARERGIYLLNSELKINH